MTNYILLEGSQKSFLMLLQAQHKLSGQPKGAYGHQVKLTKQEHCNELFRRRKSQQAFIKSCHGFQRLVPSMAPKILFEGVAQLSRIADLNLWSHPCSRSASDKHSRDTNSSSNEQTYIPPLLAVFVFFLASAVWKFDPWSLFSNPCISFEPWGSRHIKRNFIGSIWLYSWRWTRWQIMGGNLIKSDMMLSINIISISWYLGWQTGAQLLSSNKWTDQARTPILTWSWVSIGTEPDNHILGRLTGSNSPDNWERTQREQSNLHKSCRSLDINQPLSS